MRILLVEDEPKVSAFICQGLEELQFQVDQAFDGFTGRMLALKNTYQLIILDVILPHTNGYELCKEIRRNNIETPVLMLTALGTTEHKLEGFDAGADDYLVKPFEFRELVARVRSLTKRSSGISTIVNKLRIAGLELDLDKKVAIREGQTIELTSKEYALLELLMRNKGRVLSRAEIAEKVWEITFDTGTNVVDVYINILRKKIDQPFQTKLIQTKIGMGYILTENA